MRAEVDRGVPKSDFLSICNRVYHHCKWDECVWLGISPTCSRSQSITCRNRCRSHGRSVLRAIPQIIVPERRLPPSRRAASAPPPPQVSVRPHLWPYLALPSLPCPSTGLPPRRLPFRRASFFYRARRLQNPFGVFEN